MRNRSIAAVLLGAVFTIGCTASAEKAADTPEAAAPAQASELAPPAASSTPATASAVRQAPPAVAAKPRVAPASASTASYAASAAPRPAAPPKPRFRTVSAPVGTELSLELTTPLSTETAQVESPVTAKLRRPVVVDGLTVFPAGATFHGTVTEVERPGRVRGRAHLAFRFTGVTISDQRDRISTDSVSFEGEATKSEDATKVGAGAGIGAVIGGIVGGGSGAAKGAAIGGAAGAGAVLATRGRDVVLAAGSDVTTALSSPFDVRVEVQ